MTDYDSPPSSSSAAKDPVVTEFYEKVETLLRADSETQIKRSERQLQAILDRIPDGRRIITVGNEDFPDVDKLIAATTSAQILKWEEQLERSLQKKRASSS